ncbi:phosphoesterase PA-phosphatase [Micromonospora sp. BQ11]|uniref:vanadium-dependent haloperoxidase n=1 Tax=Micromonospora sp. BQ11 TaxID=3452212 RepID=UPI003F8CA22B
MRYPFESHRPTAVRRLSVAATAVAVAVSTWGVAAAPAAARSTDDVDVAVEWWDVANTMLAPPAAPVGIENFRAWAITWLAAARAVNERPSAGPARHYRKAAFAAAVHESLITFVPTRRAEIDQALATTLSRIPDGPAESQGVAAGRAETQAVLANRQGDGLDNVSVSRPFTPPSPAPGVWRPTPPALATAQWPGLADARPFSMSSPDQFRPGPPPAPGSDRYRADWQEVRDYGAIDSTVRTAEQTKIATFMYTAPPSFFHPAVRSALQELSGSLRRQAELMAVVRLAFMDAMIAVWDAKYHYVSWRPITAIREADSDGDPTTSPDPSWTPLHATPPHPDYLSGHAGLMGAVVRALTIYTGAGPEAPFTVANPNMPGVTLTYDNWAQMNRDMIDARVWSGIHTRTADVVAARVGSRVTHNIICKSRQLFG